MSLKTFFMFALLTMGLAVYVHDYHPDQAYLLIAGVAFAVIVGVVVEVIRSFHAKKNINTKFDSSYADVPSHIITGENSNAELAIYKIRELEEALHEDLAEVGEDAKKNKIDL